MHTHRQTNNGAFPKISQFKIKLPQSFCVRLLLFAAAAAEELISITNLSRTKFGFYDMLSIQFLLLLNCSLN